MAKLIEGVTEKLLDCAKVEFLEHGFQKASLRTIAQKANTDPKSIYTRFSDKEGLFGALVEPALNEIMASFLKALEEYDLLPVEVKRKLFENTEEKIAAMVDQIYNYFDVYKLLLTCSDGTRYADFIDELVEIDVQYTLKYIEAIGSDALTSGRASLDLLHILSRALYCGTYEIIVREMPRKSAYTYINQLYEFYHHGWKYIFNL